MQGYWFCQANGGSREIKLQEAPRGRYEHGPGINALVQFDEVQIPDLRGYLNYLGCSKPEKISSERRHSLRDISKTV